MVTSQGRTKDDTGAAWLRARPKGKGSGANFSALLKGLCAENSTSDHHRKTSSSRSATELLSNFIPFGLPNRKEVSADYPSEASSTRLHNSAIQR